MATTAVGVIALGWLADLPPVPYREPMKTIFRYRNDQIAVTVAKQKDAYSGTYAASLSVLEEMAGRRPRQIRIEHHNLREGVTCLLFCAVHDPDDTTGYDFPRLLEDTEVFCQRHGIVLPSSEEATDDTKKWLWIEIRRIRRPQ